MLGVGSWGLAVPCPQGWDRTAIAVVGGIPTTLSLPIPSGALPRPHQDLTGTPLPPGRP